MGNSEVLFEKCLINLMSYQFILTRNGIGKNSYILENEDYNIHSLTFKLDQPSGTAQHNQRKSNSGLDDLFNKCPQWLDRWSIL